MCERHRRDVNGFFWSILVRSIYLMRLLLFGWCTIFVCLWRCFCLPLNSISFINRKMLNAHTNTTFRLAWQRFGRAAWHIQTKHAHTQHKLRRKHTRSFLAFSCNLKTWYLSNIDITDWCLCAHTHTQHVDRIAWVFQCRTVSFSLSRSWSRKKKCLSKKIKIQRAPPRLSVRSLLPHSHTVELQ